MYKFRMIDMYDSQTGVLVDMEYDLVDGNEVFLNLKIFNIINNVVGRLLENIDPLIKIAFTANLLSILQENREN